MRGSEGKGGGGAVEREGEGRGKDTIELCREFCCRPTLPCCAAQEEKLHPVMLMLYRVY